MLEASAGQAGLNRRSMLTGLAAGSLLAASGCATTTNPVTGREQMILIDTKKAAELFARFDVPIGGYLVNRVIPEELAGQQIPAYLRNRIAMQKGELDQIRQTFGKQVVGYVPELERDVTGLPMIERVAGLLYG